MTRPQRLEDRLPLLLLLLLLAAIELMVIALAVNVRLAVVAAAAAGGVCSTRMRYSAFAAMALLGAVGCCSVVLPGP